MLFTPGHKSGWLRKAIDTGADAIIFDLEDSVPPASKEDARGIVKSEIVANGFGRTDLWVRPNSFDTDDFLVDLESIVVSGLTGLFLPKVESPEQIVAIDGILSYLERERGLDPNGIGIICSFETAIGMSRCESIASASSRVWSLLGATGPDADVARALGFEFSLEGLESLYLRSRILLAARSSGMSHVISGLWQDVRDLEGLSKFAESNRKLGYRGMIVIHPSHVPVVNSVFTPTEDEVNYSRRLIEAYYAAEKSGSSAIDFEGQHVDIAHLRTARDLVEFYESVTVK
ncbi:HpcH/HpaI aldolase/citrate lyase family protein [Brevibacterium sandarakinum]|nr:CoA ester lyase [Brevibacterium sandarakinum]